MGLQHWILPSFTEDTQAPKQEFLASAFGDLRHQIRDIVAFEWGCNISPEGLSKGFTHAFSMTFVDSASRDFYLQHPAHQAFVEQLKPYLKDVLVFDYAY